MCVCVCVYVFMVLRILPVCFPGGNWQQVRSDYKLSITSTHIAPHALPFFSPNVINLYPHAFACLQHQFENKVEREELERRQSHRGRKKKSPYRKSIVSSHLPLLPGWCSWRIIFLYIEKSQHSWQHNFSPAWVTFWQNTSGQEKKECTGASFKIVNSINRAGPSGRAV